MASSQFQQPVQPAAASGIVGKQKQQVGPGPQRRPGQPGQVQTQAQGYGQQSSLSGRTARYSSGGPGRSGGRKYTYLFGGGGADGSRDMKSILGGKGAGLHEMARLGLRVPPGFTISAELCQAYDAKPGQTGQQGQANGATYTGITRSAAAAQGQQQQQQQQQHVQQTLGGEGLPARLWEEVSVGMRHIEYLMGAPFGLQLPQQRSTGTGVQSGMASEVDAAAGGRGGGDDTLVQAMASTSVTGPTASQPEATLVRGQGRQPDQMPPRGIPQSAAGQATTTQQKAQPQQELQQQQQQEVPQPQQLGLEYPPSNFQPSPGAAPVLLVSVRSGAAVSMPGMMDTVLNLGLNDAAAEALIAATGNPRFVWDSYRRYIDMFGDVVMNVDHAHFEAALSAMKQAKGVEFDVQLDAEALQELVRQYKSIYAQHTGQEFPEDPDTALKMAILAVFRSWNNPRAVAYRKINKISSSVIGTAVNVQAMVFGNMGGDSGTGVLFTRNPSTGENVLWGEFLVNAQGEDVVAGIRTPQPISQLQSIMPSTYDELYSTVKNLEAHMADMQDVEFTVMKSTLYILQTRDGKRTGAAALRIAKELVDSGMATKETAVSKLVNCSHIDQLLHPQFKDQPSEYKKNLIGQGIAASPGAAVGRVVFTAEDAEAWCARGEAVILVRSETSAEDVSGMNAAKGILTTHGGMTSHAAVVARGWGKPCVCGCGDVSMSTRERRMTSRVTGESFTEGDWISINGTTGEVVKGRLELVPPQVSPLFTEFLGWARSLAPIRVHANADSPADVIQALTFGAQGIGLCRTEHMFWGEPRIRYMREVIMGQTLEAREAALDQLFPFQKDDFKGIFIAAAKQDVFDKGTATSGVTPSKAAVGTSTSTSTAAGGQGSSAVHKARPVTIRLLDPPLHEYLPREPSLIKSLASDMGMEESKVLAIIKGMRESNPMLGHRGCRVEITHPEIPKMQTRAIITAACEAVAEGYPVDVEIMVPLVGTKAELDFVKEVIDAEAAACMAKTGITVHYTVGNMLETPRAALVADQIARTAAFFSFGTNDLTQMTFGYSRDDAPKFIPKYVDARILPDDPFQSLDIEGVGALVRMAITKGRSVKPTLPIGVCGEVGGDERSVHFFVDAGCDYVSCSPFRVPVAILAAAQAGLKKRNAANAAAAAATGSSGGKQGSAAAGREAELEVAKDI